MVQKYSYKDITLNSENTVTIPKSELKTLDLGHLFVFELQNDVIQRSSVPAYISYSYDNIVITFPEQKTGTFRVLRSTPYDALWHDFNNGAKFTDTNIEEVWLQLLYLYQEILEGKYVPEN